MLGANERARLGLTCAPTQGSLLNAALILVLVVGATVLFYFLYKRRLVLAIDVVIGGTMALFNAALVVALLLRISAWSPVDAVVLCLCALNAAGATVAVIYFSGWRAGVKGACAPALPPADLAADAPDQPPCSSAPAR